MIRSCPSVLTFRVILENMDTDYWLAALCNEDEAILGHTAIMIDTRQHLDPSYLDDWLGLGCPLGHWVRCRIFCIYYSSESSLEKSTGQRPTSFRLGRLIIDGVSLL